MASSKKVNQNLNRDFRAVCKVVAMNQKSRVLAVGLIPVVLFTLIEEYYGTLWGLIAGFSGGFTG